MKLFALILFITLTVFAVGGGILFGVIPTGHHHEYGEWQTRTPATCTESGLEFRSCECGEAEENRLIPATGHSYAEYTVLPTCTEKGYTTYTCNCGHSYVGNETETTGHKYETVVTNPTCTENGYTTLTCSCGDTQTGIEIAATGHDYEEVVTEPTCTEGGYTTYTCHCGDSYTGNETGNLGHIYTEVVDEKYLATNNCGEKATYYKSCHCGEKSEETFEYGDILEHQYEAVVTAPTCTDDGYTTYTCNCGHSYVGNEVASSGHNIVDMKDDTHHWTACANNCGTESEKIAHSANSISATFGGTAMEGITVKAEDLTVTATCECGKEFAVTEGITIENGTLALGENTVTVKVGDVSLALNINAAPFNVTVNGTIVDDTYVNSGTSTNTNNYADRTELYIYNTGAYRVLFRFNFSDVLNSQYYTEFGNEAIVKFTFTVTNGVDLTGLPITFKSYLTSDIRSSADFSMLTWKNYSSEYTLGWGSETDSNNTVSLLSKETVGNRATYADGKLVITVTLRELEGCIDENGNAIFVMLTNQSSVKPFVASMENETYDAPAVQVVFSNDHAHAYIEQVVEEKFLASANCEKKATYYYSCSCGEASTDTFAYGEVIEHSYGQWIETQAPTCTDAAVETHTCDKCGKSETQVGRDAIGHEMITVFDETNHWTVCKNSCGTATEPAAHFGGEATETEKAICEGCGQPYGGLASHVHSFSEWETHSPAGCEHDEVLIHYCDCGVSETSKGVAAFGHDIQTKYDENNHWTECVHNCGLSTDPVAHFGGEATESEKAVCEGCGQSYGEFKPAEKKEYTINGTIVEDTYVNTSTSYRDSTYSDKNFVATFKDSARAYFKFDFSNIINSEDFDENDPNAKIQFVFAACKNPNNSYKYIPFDDTIGVTFAGFAPGDGTTGVNFNTLSYNSIGELHWTNGTGLGTLLSGNTVSQKPDNISISEDGATLTLTFTYAEIKQFIGEDGLAVFTFRSSNIKPCIATMENTAYAIPEVKYVYEK
ncbi:MAG: hypothetical protein J6V80_03315 [Clostridia bacterium]|nr:hypothetical protein [Clostridia bacterium]